MKDVKFPMRLDLSELCASSLKEKFKPMVAQIRDFENKLSLTNNESSIKILTKRQDNGVISLPEQKLGPGDSGSGIYQLIAVLTHEGRTTSSGHYVAWVRFEPKKWAKMDDATVSLVEENDILKLSGGGESHCAYLLIYQTFKVPKI
uniref:ubiquitinyl hydrolase 1 n=1 Tax=Henneguya salminicola TaxID=69463 RepID=A0A6G3MK50_HENSL